MLSVHNLNAWLPDSAASTTRRTDIQLLHGVTLQVETGQTVALVGESGSGKTITALSILRLLENTTPIRINGAITFAGQELLELPLAEMRSIRGNRIAMIFQEPMTSLNPVFTIGNQLIEPLLLHRNMTQEAARKEAIALLERTGIDDAESRLGVYPHQLSGGQRQRVMIAMAVAGRPTLLIADEPTTALDVSIQAQILKLIKDLQQEFGMAMLLITHDLAMVRRIAEQIYIMKDGAIVESGPPESLFTRPNHPYTRHLIEAIPQPAVEQKGDSPVVLKTELLSCSFRLLVGRQGLFKRRYKTIKAVDEVTLSIREGTTCGIIGESGSGKTTLALAVLRLLPSTGSIVFQGRELQSLSTRELRPIRSQVQIVFQDPFSSLSPRLSIGEIVEEGLRVHHKNLSPAARLERVREALADVGLSGDIVHRYPHEFSGGQRQRIAVARAVVLRPRLLILDEPTSALDMTIQRQIIELLKDLQRKYTLTYLFISHDLKTTRALADYIIVMRNGAVVEQGPARAIFDNPRQPYTRDLLNAALFVTPDVETASSSAS
ncbi:ABC transporter ATP-binding protein [Desulfofustis glycolicus]|uniref:Microcin C transport system ATP-binding protein n=1 Tax=Desulfofustis glycolicus DSM 9705 TaxID=1121409 RepID=A0A1M5Y2Y3_9BACT|nr:dipeptide ABC transporter ATP-binding protein [Desulfofustis glycolicus]MCB2214865.1 dipeptide ABC transporter ATP-binding protein [Desulfobulbaceae bacterium]SHI06450.1 microcin C transport system ATP-binding protein [Desulfofustis glycolicus DSM 9705]